MRKVLNNQLNRRHTKFFFFIGSQNRFHLLIYTPWVYLSSEPRSLSCCTNWIKSVCNDGGNETRCSDGVLGMGATYKGRVPRVAVTEAPWWLAGLGVVSCSPWCWPVAVHKYRGAWCNISNAAGYYNFYLKAILLCNKHFEIFYIWKFKHCYY